MSTLQDFELQETHRMREWERRVEAMVRAKGGTVSAKEFQSIVNVVFHDVEAASYDKLHREIWESSKLIFDRLATDAARALPVGDVTLADVGCGTGSATEFLLSTPLRSRIDALMMIDTSREMLDRCKTRSASWPVKPTFIHGQIDEAPDSSADLMVVSSVLHHLPDLVGFCGHIHRVLRPGGVFIHIHDPNQGGENHPAYQERKARYYSWLVRQRRSLFRLPATAFKWLSRRAVSLFKGSYLDEVNRRLINQGVITEPLKPREIWSITDLRAGDLPISAVDGVSKDELAAALTGFECLSFYTYNFFGVMRSHLPPDMAQEEVRLFQESCTDGIRIAGVWKRHQ